MKRSAQLVPRKSASRNPPTCRRVRGSFRCLSSSHVRFRCFRLRFVSLSALFHFRFPKGGLSFSLSLLPRFHVMSYWGRSPPYPARGVPGGVWGGGFLKRPQGVLGPSWGVLEQSWGVLESSCDVLGASWGLSAGNHQKNRACSLRKCTPDP